MVSLSPAMACAWKSSGLALRKCLRAAEEVENADEGEKKAGEGRARRRERAGVVRRALSMVKVRLRYLVKLVKVRLDQTR
jgi:hypothetical protein